MEQVLQKTNDLFCEKSCKLRSKKIKLLSRDIKLFKTTCYRLVHLSFGELVPGIINPLDGTEKIALDRKYLKITVGICM